MWFSDIFRRLKPARPAGRRAQPREEEAWFDTSFLRRLDRLVLRTSPRLRGHSAGQRTSWRRLPSNDFREHRLYMPGDDLRHVDWNASARSEHVFVKLGERPREATIHLLSDTTASMQWGKPSKLWAARRLTAAVGYLTLKHGDRLSAASLADLNVRFGPSHGKGRVPALLRFVRDLPAARRADLVETARRYTARHGRGGYAVVISDLLGLDDVDALLNCFPAPGWQVLVLHLLHAAELDPTVRGEVEFVDAETGERANFDLDARAVERYRTHARQWCDRLEAACYERQVTYVRVLSDWPIERAVMPYLQRRGVVDRS